MTELNVLLATLIEPASVFKPRLYELGSAQLAEWCEARGFPKYRAEQIRRWIFGRRANDFAEMHDIPNALRLALAAEFSLFPAQIAKHQVGSDRTEKMLLELHDGQFIECVLMREQVSARDTESGREVSRRTVCISTQVGCAMGCVFCASGLLGLKRNLTTGEILEQVLRMDRLLPKGEQITNVVVMGIGEPLANLKALIPALDSLNEKGGLGLGARRITVSTVGLPEKIRELARLGKQYNLAVSLHAPNDALRDELVPINRTYPLAELLDACRRYVAHNPHSQITFEYVMLAGVNDHVSLARDLVRLLQGLPAKLNLIPFNPIEGAEYQCSSLAVINRFREELMKSGIVTITRKTRGSDIDAACGQLVGRVAAKAARHRRAALAGA